MNAQQIQSQQRRLQILQILAEDNNYSENDTIIHSILETQGVSVSRDVLRSELAWLEDQQLVSLLTLPSCTVAVLREAGLDVATGTKVIPGIAKIGLS